MLNQMLQKIRNEKDSLESFATNKVNLVKLALLRMLNIASDKGE